MATIERELTMNGSLAVPSNLCILFDENPARSALKATDGAFHFDEKNLW